MRTEADIQDWPDRQHCEQDPLQEAQRTRQLAEQNLTSEGSEEDQRDAVETKCIEGDADRAFHAFMPACLKRETSLERKIQGVGRMVEIGCHRCDEHDRKQCQRQAMRAPPRHRHHNEDTKEQYGEFHLFARLQGGHFEYTNLQRQLKTMLNENAAPPRRKPTI